MPRVHILRRRLAAGDIPGSTARVSTPWPELPPLNSRRVLPLIWSTAAAVRLRWARTFSPRRLRNKARLLVSFRGLVALELMGEKSGF